jgi:predicted PurR-regulated permease PerM
MLCVVEGAHTDQRRAIVGQVALGVALGAVAVLALVRAASIMLPILKIAVLACLISLALNPVVDWLARRKVPRPVAAIGMAALAAGAIAVAAWLVVPPAVREGADLAKGLPSYWDEGQRRLERAAHHYPWIVERLKKVDLAGEITSRSGQVVEAVGAAAAGAVGAIFSLVVLVMAVVFILLKPGPLVDGILGLVPRAHAQKARDVAWKMAEKIRAWLWGVVLLMIAVGLMVWAGLSIVGVPYAFLFGALAGLLEVVPTIGPVLSAVPPCLLALAQEPRMALWVILVFVATNQIENNLLVPIIMSRRLELHPASLLLGFLVMTGLFGLFGAVVAMPAVACVKVLYEELYLPWAHPQKAPAEPDA